MPNTVTLAGVLSTPRVVVAVFGNVGAGVFTVIYDDGSVFNRVGLPDNDWTEGTPLPLSARAVELDTYSYVP